MSFTTTIFVLPVFLLLYMAIPTLLLSILQLFLCRKELKWGRILPIFSAVVSVLHALFVLLFCINAAGAGTRVLILAVPLALLVLNIPTLIYCLIYRSARKKNTRADLNRTRINDLE